MDKRRPAQSRVQDISELVRVVGSWLLRRSGHRAHVVFSDGLPLHPTHVFLPLQSIGIGTDHAHVHADPRVVDGWMRVWLQDVARLVHQALGLSMSPNRWGGRMQTHRIYPRRMTNLSRWQV